MLGLSACDNGGGSATAASGVSLSGIGIDGLLQGSTVCIDVDKSETCDLGEPTTQTDMDGKFTLPGTTQTGPLLLVGGIDKSTGEAFKGVLKAPAGSKVVTPLTSAIQSMVENGKSAVEAEIAIKTAMGLSDISVDLTQFDPYNGIDGNNSTDAQKILAKQTQLQVLVHTASATIAGADANVDINTTMSNVFDAIVESMDTGAEVELDAKVVARATRKAAAKTFPGDDVKIVAIGTVSTAAAQRAVTAANGAKDAIGSGNASDAISKLDGAINDVNKEDGNETATEIRFEAANLPADPSADLAKILAARDAEDTAAAAAAAQKAEAVAARVAADTALVEAQTKAELEAAEKLREAAAAAEKLAAQKAKDEAEKSALAANEEKLIDPAAPAKEIAAQTAKAEAEAAELEADIEEQAAAAAAAAIAAADEAAELQALKDTAAAAALAAEQARAAELISSYKIVANNAAIDAQASADALQVIAVSYSVDVNLTTANTAATRANDIATTLNSYADTNTTYVIGEKNRVLTQAQIAADALKDAQAIKAAVDSEALITQAKIDRITIVLAEVEAIKAAAISIEANVTSIKNSIESNMGTITDIAANYSDAADEFVDANSSATIAFEAYQNANTSLSLINTAYTNAEQALVDINETAVNEAKSVATTEKVKMDTYLVVATDKAAEVAALRTTVESIKTQVDAAAAQAEADRVALAINNSKTSAQTALDLALQAAIDAGNSAQNAQGSATAAATIAGENANAQTHATAAEGYATTAATQAVEAQTAAALAEAEMARVFVTNVADITETAAADAATLIASYSSSALAAKELVLDAEHNAAAELVLAQNVSIEPSGGLSEGMSLHWLEIEDDEFIIGKVILAAGGDLVETAEKLDVASASFVSTTDYSQELILQDNGSWTVEGASTYTLLNGTISVSNGEDIKIMNTFELDNPIGPAAVAINEINSMIPGDENLTFSAGAKAYQLAFKKEESYSLNYMPTECSEWGTNSCIGTEVPYSSLEVYMASHNSPAGMEDEWGYWIGVDFERNVDANLSPYTSNIVVDSTGAEVTTLVAGQTGNLVLYDAASPSGDVDRVGTWEVVTLPNSQLAISMASLSGYEAYFSDNLIAVANGAVYKGEHNLGSTTFVTEEHELNFNEIAVNDIKAAIIAYTQLAPTTGPIAAVLAQGNGVWGEYKYGATGYDNLVACYDYNSDGTFTYTTGTESSTFFLNESGSTLNWVDANGVNAGPEITISSNYTSSLMSLDMNWNNVHDNREWHKMDSCSIGSTSTAQFEVDVERLTLTDTTWTWQDLIDVNGTLVNDPNSEVDEQTIVVNADDTISIDSGTIKYLGESVGSDFNASIFSSSSTIYKIAFIRDEEELDFWGESVQDDNGTIIDTLENIIAYYTGASGEYRIHDDALPENYTLAFYMDEIVVVDQYGMAIQSYNDVYTYTIENGSDTQGNYRILKIFNAAQEWNIAFIQRDTGVERGSWAGINSGGIFTLYSETAKDEFIDWYNANADTFTHSLWFEESKVNWRAEFNALTTSNPNTFIGLGTLYSLGVDESYSEEPIVENGGFTMHMLTMIPTYYIVTYPDGSSMKKGAISYNAGGTFSVNQEGSVTENGSFSIENGQVNFGNGTYMRMVSDGSQFAPAVAEANLFDSEGNFMAQRLFFTSEADRDSYLGIEPSFNYEEYFDHTKYFVDENGLKGFRTYNLDESSYVGNDGQTEVGGGFFMLNGVMVHTRVQPSALGIAFTYVGVSGEGVLFNQSTDQAAPIDVYMYDTQAQRDAAATAAGL